MRAHFNRPLLDREGNQIDSATVRLLLPGTFDLVTDTIYADTSGGSSYTNPWTITSGEVDFYLDTPTRVRIGITAGTGSEEVWDDVDVLAVGSDSFHPGAGADSTQVGANSAAGGVGAVVVGASAVAEIDNATAVGYQASVTGDGGVAAGALAAASQPGAVAVGRSALADGSQSAAVGDATQALFDQSVAIGAGVQTDRPNQIRLGTPAEIVDIPGLAVLHSPDGTPWVLGVTDEGLLYTLKLEPYEAPPPPEQGE